MLKYSSPYQPLTTANTSLLRHYLQENGAYYFHFNGKEADNEINGTGNNYDFGARIYDARLGRWLSVDPLQAKYQWLSPYNFVANNPILYIDNDGKDYGVYVDHESKTIIIKATYLVNKHDELSNNSAEKAAQFWNEQTGKFQYIINNGKEKIVYDIKFEFDVKESDNPSEDSNNNKDANAYYVKPDKDPSFNGKSITNSKEEIVNGVTDKFRNEISVKATRAFLPTGAHEMGHTLGIGHWTRGLMFWASNGRENKISKGLVKMILNNGNVGNSNPPFITSDAEVEDPGYRGKISGPVNSEENVKGSAPKNFDKGKVVLTKT
ncbi:MAG: hypothetical protein CFE21_13665 [Bacteroidetes bacterium B1(2017)]|nr:MAG: hypothetical protein CFE21_13665 [Bacteroidetes bacterium B1(2017)]